MARKRYSCDFETTTNPDDCRVWAYGWMEVGNIENYRIGNDLGEFINWCEKVQADLYFHNERFDGEFIVNYLLKVGWKWVKKPKQYGEFTTTISNMGQWYVIELCYGYKGRKKLHTTIYDSLKKLPFPVKKIAKDFGLPIEKGDIDYHLERPIGWEITPDEHKYIKNDIEIIARALKIQFEQGLDRMTAGSDSLKGFKSVISKKTFEKLFPVMSIELDANIRMAYRGGFTWVNDRFKGKEIGEGMVFDVNSLYPAQMYDKPLPYGLPIFYQGKYENDEKFPLYIQHIRCSFIVKDEHIPTIQIKKNMRFKQNEYLKDSGGEIVDLYMTNVDMELLFSHYYVYDLEYCEGWKFRQKIGIFKDFIDKWMYIKTTQKGAIKQLAKLMLNSLYGKFASNPNVSGKIPYLKDDGSCGFRAGEEEFKDPIYTPMGIFITSWARYYTITTAQKCYDRIIYCDTDSIHLTGTEIPDAIKDVVDPDKLGYWKLEYYFKKAKYIRQKTYVDEVYGKMVWDEKEQKEKFETCSIEESTTTKLEVKCAGMPDSIKKFVTFENFEVGFKSKGKLMPKHVSGGIVLVDTTFEIK